MNLSDIYVALGINIILLLSIGSVYILLPLLKTKNSILINVLIGTVFGVVGLLIMSSQFEIAEGIFLDTRSVLVSLVAAFFGIIPFILTFFFTATLRFIQGGVGAFTGIVVILNTGMIGYFYGKYRLKKFEELDFKLLVDFYILGVATHLVMLITFFFLPLNIALSTLKEITIPVLILYPIATVLIAVVLFKQRQNIKLARKVDDISKHDYLTGLYNRFYYDQIINEINTKEHLPISIIMGDVNGLKFVNDTFGHFQGDKLLIAIANILKQNVKDNEILSRWGGDEFIIIMPNTFEVDATKRMIEITKQLSEVVLDHEIVPSISLGIGTKMEMSKGLDKTLKQAEDMMYRNKLSSGSSTRSHLISILENALLERSLETTTHTNNMEILCIKIAEKMDLSSSQKDELRLISKLHDIGKIGVSDKILLKQGKLTDEEYNQIKKHAEIGYRILSSINELEHIATGVLCHHEKWDGTGYPQGLKEDEIPLLSRIVSIADAYEVMTNGRVYKSSISREEAMEEIISCSGTQFDPEIAQIFIETIK